MQKHAPVLLLVNPTSGGGQARAKLPAIEATFNECKVNYRLRFTETDLHAAAIVRQALSSRPKVGIAVVGGDGTLNEAVNGFFADDGSLLGRESWLGLLPSGSGSDFARSMHLPKQGGEAVRYMLASATRSLDVGHVKYTTEHGQMAERYFLNIASFGLSGATDRIVNRSSKLLGRFAHLNGALRALHQYKPQDIELIPDGRGSIKRKSWCTVIANGQFFGGGMHIAKNANLQDGYFELIDIGTMSFLKKLSFGTSLYGNTSKLPNEVIAHRIQHLKALPSDPSSQIPIDLDGESPGFLPAEFKVLPQALRFRG
ncbi:MAG: diacylglycerol kinase family lipid kinase [Myxococcales bacterium]|nr:MAG: diacylglycerol kinase family lipid kinase [Myxococcales bacterium]